MKHYSILLAFTLWLTACDSISKSIRDTLRSDTSFSPQPQNKQQPLQAPAPEPVPEAAPREPFAANPAALNEAEQLLRNRPEFKGKQIQVYKSIHFYSNYRVLTQLQNPDNPAYVDEYYFTNGKWEDPKPVRLSKNTDVAADLVPLDAVPFANAHNVYKALLEKYREIGGNPGDLTIYVILWNKKIRWYPGSIHNDRYDYDIEFKQDGTLRRFEQR